MNRLLIIVTLILSFAAPLIANHDSDLTWDTVEARLDHEAEEGFSGVFLGVRNGEVVL